MKIKNKYILKIPATFLNLSYKMALKLTANKINYSSVCCYIIQIEKFFSLFLLIEESICTDIKCNNSVIKISKITIVNKHRKISLTDWNVQLIAKNELIPKRLVLSVLLTRP